MVPSSSSRCSPFTTWASLLCPLCAQVSPGWPLMSYSCSPGLSHLKCHMGLEWIYCIFWCRWFLLATTKVIPPQKEAASESPQLMGKAEHQQQVNRDPGGRSWDKRPGSGADPATTQAPAEGPWAIALCHQSQLACDPVSLPRTQGPGQRVGLPNLATVLTCFRGEKWDCPLKRLPLLLPRGLHKS